MKGPVCVRERCPNTGGERVSQAPSSVSLKQVRCGGGCRDRMGTGCRNAIGATARWPSGFSLPVLGTRDEVLM